MALVKFINVYFNWQRHHMHRHHKHRQPDEFSLNCPALELKENTSYFLHGRSGVGKSTLLGLIGGTIHPLRGKIFVNGVWLDSLNRAELDKHRADSMGIIFQNFNLVPYLSAMENILLPLQFSKIKRQRAGASSEERKIGARNLLEKLDFNVERDGTAFPENLSIGQQQRVAAARALIGKPKLIIADEPTSALDEENQYRFVDLLLSQATSCGANVLMVSHNKRLAGNFNETLHLENGTIGSGLI